MNRGFAAIGLDHPKCPANVGGAMRAAGCYGASIVAMAGHRFGKAPTDVQKQWRLTPVIQTDDLRLVVPYDCVPVAVDLIPGATALQDYQHPERRSTSSAPRTEHSASASRRGAVTLCMCRWTRAA